MWQIRDNSWFMERQTHKINASGKILGRLAVEVAILLRGKHKPDFSHYKDMGDFIEIINLNKIKFSGKKFEQKIYWHHTGYPGGIKSQTLKELFEKDPQKVFLKAVKGMLPKNKLAAKQIKRLRFL